MILCLYRTNSKRWGARVFENKNANICTFIAPDREEALAGLCERIRRAPPPVKDDPMPGVREERSFIKWWRKRDPCPIQEQDLLQWHINRLPELFRCPHCFTMGKQKAGESHVGYLERGQKNVCVADSSQVHPFGYLEYDAYSITVVDLPITDFFDHLMDES